jgi:hypothetical protein
MRVLLYFKFKELWTPTLQQTSTRLLKRTFGMGDDSVIKMKKNAFRYPNQPDAEIPQAKQPIFVDRRSKSAPTEYLVKEKGMKHKNILKQENAERLESELKKVQEKVEGNIREGEVIDLNKMVDVDEYGNIQMDAELDFNKEKKAKKTKNSQMDVDHFEISEERNTRRNLKNKKKKKTKSHFIVNY